LAPLLEFCALVNSLIIDEDGIYDPRLVNDRLLLGLKGTFSELELSIFRQRSQEALRLKAARGDLYTTVAIGYRRSADDRLEQDPDLRIREALSLVFRKHRWKTDAETGELIQALASALASPRSSWCTAWSSPENGTEDVTAAGGNTAAGAPLRTDATDYRSA
jgi:DNA invertase Pin-like site-specific DNA recombinase